jgi:hypothetical protein
MKLKARINYFFPCEVEVNEAGELSEPRMKDGIMAKYFMWLFYFISWLKSFAWVREGLSPMFEIWINKKDFEEYKKKYERA